MFSQLYKNMVSKSTLSILFLSNQIALVLNIQIEPFKWLSLQPVIQATCLQTVNDVRNYNELMIVCLVIKTN